MIVKVERLGHDGEGIAYINRKPVYIYYAYLDEEVKIQLNKNKRGAFEGKLLKVIKESPNRIIPKCPYYGVCGGCNLMHIDYVSTLKYKRDTINFLLSTKLRKETKKTKLNLTIPSPDIYNYRNKIDIPIEYKNGKNKMGLFYRGTNRFMEIENCIIHENVLDETIKTILKKLDKNNIKGYNPKNKKADITHISLRINEKNEQQLTFVKKKNISLKKLSEEILNENPKIISIYESYVPNLKTNRDIFSGKLNLLAGDKYLKMGLSEYKFYLSPNSFFQLNTKQALNMYKKIVEIANFKKEDIVLDAFSGVGTIATFISPYVKEVVAIESIKDAVRAMDIGIEKNKIKNIKSITGDVIKVSNYLKTKFDVMVFDPPRIGLGKEIVDYILKMEPRKVIYVSCDPKTLVRDLKKLSNKYQIESITPVDMFPQTSHIESITILNKK